MQWSESMGYTNEKLEAIAAKLKTMPVIEKKKREHSKQDAVKVLSKEIAALQKRGYTLDQIAETLRGEGLEITTPTLKSYLQRIKAGQKNQSIAAQKTESQKTITPVSKIAAETGQASKESKAAFTPKPDSDDI
jgi:methionine synthase II (cobalamin-independent)